MPDFTAVHLPGGGVDIHTEHLRLRYDGAEFSEGGLSVALLKGAVDAHYSSWRYGFAYPQSSYQRNLLGTARTLDNADGEVELEFGILATYGFAVVDDSASALLSNDGWIAARPASERPRKDLYLFAYGNDFAAALRDYHRLTGPVPVVPRYVLGNWWSRFWPYDEDEYLTLLDRFEAEQIPLSVAVIDMDWHLVDIDPNIGTGWTGYTWNRDLFPDPERFLGAVHEHGLATTLNLHPADGVRRHEDAYSQVAGAMGIDPSSGLPVEFDVTSREFVDAYLRYLHHPLEEKGVDFWWIDWQSGGATSVAGLDPLWMLNHIHFLDSGRDGKRPLTFSRYAGPGSHRYPVGFSGDTITTWASLDFQPYFTATAANVGYTWWSHDIGGHMFGSKDTGLTVRWFQFGVFSPINRLHSSPNPFFSKEPWDLGAEASGIVARFMRLRHRLVPMLYTAAWRAHTDAVGVVRPMYHDHHGEMLARQMPNQYMLGEHLLVAPITSPEDAATKLARTTVWLPDGDWFDIFTGQRYEGGNVVPLYRQLGQIPVLARAGAVLPLVDAIAPLVDAPAKLTLRVYPGDGISHLSEDHGEGTPSEPNVTRFVQSMTVRDDGLFELRLIIEPTTGLDPLSERELMLEIVGVVACEDREGAAVTEDELLSPALKVDLGVVDMTVGADVTLVVVPGTSDMIREAFVLLDAAEIEYTTKQVAWRAIQRFGGLALAQGLASLDLPQSLRDALLERAAAVDRPLASDQSNGWPG